jgi:lysophospholipase L1-like esterase
VLRVRKANPRAAILFTTNTDSYYKKKYPNKNAEAVRDVMLRLARKHRAAVWDCYAVMGGLGSIKTWIGAGLANTDKVHLVKPGYELLADLLFNAVMQDYDLHLQQLYQNQN